MNKNSSKTIAFIGVMAALIFGLLALETQVFAAILPVSPCYLSLPLAVSLSVYRRDVKGMFIGGTTFGLVSFILSFIFGLTWFMNPLISVLPRVIFGITACLTYMGLCKATAKSNNKFVKKYLPAGVSGIVGAITNTVFVVLGFVIFGWQGLREALLTILSLNALIEIICCAVLVPVLTNAARKFYKLDEVVIEEDEEKTDDKNSETGDIE